MAGEEISKPTRVGLDSNVLFDLADENRDSWDAIETIRQRVRFPVFMVLPTVIDELAHATELKDDGERAALAARALTSLRRVWKFQPLEFVPVGHGIVERIADRILERRFLPAAEKNDALILAEAALSDCTLLVTSDKHLLGVPPAPLRLLLQSQDVCTPLIVSPWTISHTLALKR